MVHDLWISTDSEQLSVNTLDFSVCSTDMF